MGPILHGSTGTTLSRRTDLFPAEREVGIFRWRIEFSRHPASVVNRQHNGRRRIAIADRLNGFDTGRLQSLPVLRQSAIQTVDGGGAVPCQVASPDQPGGRAQDGHDRHKNRGTQRDGNTASIRLRLAHLHRLRNAPGCFPSPHRRNQAHVDPVMFHRRVDISRAVQFARVTMPGIDGSGDDRGCLAITYAFHGEGGRYRLPPRDDRTAPDTARRSAVGR